MIYLAMVSLLWAFSFGLIGSALSGVDSFFVATVRLGCATLLFLPFLRTKEVVRIDRLRLILIGAVQFGVMYACYMRAFQYLPSHLVAIFSVLTPVYVVILSTTFAKGPFPPATCLPPCSPCSVPQLSRQRPFPRGDFWVGFGLMQAAGIAFAYGQVAYRDWKRNNPQTPDRSVFCPPRHGRNGMCGYCR